VGAEAPQFGCGVAEDLRQSAERSPAQEKSDEDGLMRWSRLEVRKCDAEDTTREQSKRRPPVAFHQRRSCSTAVGHVREPAEKPVAMMMVADHVMPIFVGLCSSLQSSERKHTDCGRRGQHEDCSAHCETPVG